MAPRKRKVAAKRRPTRTGAKRRAPATRRAAKAATRAAKTSPTATPPAAGATTIVYVHGIGNKPIASVLKAQWDHALFGFDVGERSRMAYWVDRDRYPVPLEQTTLADEELERLRAQLAELRTQAAADAVQLPR